jgi:membrane protein implicated in regulation of membrane protease activity
MLRPGITRERLAGLSLLGMLLFSPIFISIFDLGGQYMFFGLPVLFAYLFGVWAALVGVAALLIIRRQREVEPPMNLDDGET